MNHTQQQETTNKYKPHKSSYNTYYSCLGLRGLLKSSTPMRNGVL